MRFVARIAGWTIVVVAMPVIGGAALGRLGVVVGTGLGIFAWLWLWLWLPRAAHAAFELGHYPLATRRYRLLGALAGTRARERAALLSRAACALAAGRIEDCKRLLAIVARDDPSELDAAERAVWLNNRACAALAAGHDPHAALVLADAASALRPDVPALQHTRGMALLAVGRVDDAIALLDGMRAAGELSPRLEADRCRELARAWLQKGEQAYAEDYQRRADALGR